MLPQIKKLQQELFSIDIVKWSKKQKKYIKVTKRVRELVKESYPGNAPRTKPTDRYPQGQIKSDEDVIKECNHPVLQRLVEYTKLEKKKSTYVNKFISTKNTPIHPSFDTLKSTGRVSSYEPNIQNQPREGGLRECYKARPGHVFVFCDYDSQEMRTLAEVCLQICGKSTLAEMYAKDPEFDPHTFYACQLLNISYEEGLKRKKAGDPEILALRQHQGKATNFGLPGGLGANGLVGYAKGRGLILALQEAEILRNKWFERWPEMKDYFRVISHITRSGSGRVTQLMSGRVRGNCRYTQAANTYFQGLASDASKSALYEVAKKCFDDPGTSGLAGCRPVVFIHDEIGIEAPESYMLEAARELEVTMMAAMDEVCPHVPSRASSIITRRWSKKAKKVYNKEGRIIPWNM